MAVIETAVVAALAAPALGWAFEQAAAALDRRRHPMAGALVDVDGTRLHAAVSGRRAPGDPAIVLDGGLRANSLAWPLVEPLLSQRYQVVRFDRAGHLWSAPGRHPRDAARNVSELEALLRALGVAPPYVCVAHSYSGFLARIFADRHADKMAGLVLAETTTLQLAEMLFSDPTKRSKRTRQLRLTQLGVARLMRAFAGRSGQQPAEGLAAAISTFMRLSAGAKDVAATFSEIDSFVANGRVAEAVANYGDLPLAIIASPCVFAEFPQPPGMSREEADAWNVQTQRDLARLSSRSVFWIAQQSGHEIPWEQPEIIVRAVDWAVQSWRGQSAPVSTKATDGR